MFSISVENAILIAAGAFLLFSVSIIILLIMTIRSNKYGRKELTKQLSGMDKTLFSESAEILAEKLNQFAKTTLTDKINGYYTALINEELLPSVNKAADTINELSQAVVLKQETGMKELAEAFADMLTERTNESVALQSEIISQLKITASTFSEQLTEVSASVKELNELQNYTLEMSNNLSTSVAESVDVLCNKIRSLEEIYNGTTGGITQLQHNIAESALVIRELTESTAAAQRSAEEATQRLTEYSQNTAALLNSAVSEMQRNTESAAVSVIDEFSKKININYQAVTQTVESLQEITKDINKSAALFESAISRVYEDFSSQLNKNLDNVVSTVAESVLSEYNNLTESAEKYSQNLSENASSINNQLNSHVNSLNNFTEQLNSKLDSFNSEMNLSANRFETGIDQSVSNVLDQIDSSVSDIAKRLSDVTVNIKEAADSIPKHLYNK